MPSCGKDPQAPAGGSVCGPPEVQEAGVRVSRRGRPAEGRQATGGTKLSPSPSAGSTFSSRLPFPSVTSEANTLCLAGPAGGKRVP